MSFCFILILLYVVRTEIVRVAVVQTSGSPLNNMSQPEPLDVKRNLEYMSDIVETASSEGAKIAVFPELFLTGYNIGKSLIDELAEVNDGPSLQYISNLSKSTSVSIIYGYPEKGVEDKGNSTIVYNSANVVSSTGELALTYRKAHLFGEGEKSIFTPGPKLGPVIELEGMKIGVIICYDVEFPESVRVLALEGSQVVFVPTANMEPFDIVNDMFIPVRAASNNLYVFYTNRVGWENATTPHLRMLGNSVVADPSGNVLVKMSDKEDQMALVDVDTSQCGGHSSWSYLENRRPELYGIICED